MKRQRVYECFGERKNMRQWSRDPRCRCSYEVLHWRLIRAGWDIQKALETPAGKEFRKQRTPKKTLHQQAMATATNVLDFLDICGGDDGFAPAKQPEPTDALPGTDEKVDVLAERVRDGVDLWHPDDRRCYDRSQPFVPMSERVFSVLEIDEAIEEAKGTQGRFAM